MRAFAEAWTRSEIVQAPLAQMTWGGGITLFSIGVAEWQTRLTQSLPDELKDGLPSIEEIEAELNR